MRWLYLDPPTPEDMERREKALTAIEAWWAAFAGKLGELDALFEQQTQWDLVGWMHQHLHAVHPELMWEFGPGSQGGHRLSITPEVERRLRPMVTTLIERAPSIDGWEFLGYRPPTPDSLEAVLQGRTGLDPQGLQGRAEIGENHRIDVTFRLPGMTDAGKVDELAFVASETLFGEEALDAWIGVIQLDHEGGGAGGGADGWLDPAALTQEVTRLQGEVRERLPERPRYELRDEVQWSGIELRPPKLDEYPNRSDLLGATTFELEAFKTAHSNQPFYSERFSRLGETFCYLKIERTGAAQDDPIRFRAGLEDTLHAALAGQGLGGHTGGGTGLRYSYVDLALTDVPAAIPVIRSTLAGSGISPRSWLLFFDDVLQAEWVGLREDSPPPPVLLP